MSLPKIGGTLVLDNEAQFKKALAEVNQGLRVNQSNMRLVEEQSKMSGDAQKALQAKMDALSDTIASQVQHHLQIRSRAKGVYPESRRGICGAFPDWKPRDGNFC